MTRIVAHGATLRCTYGQSSARLSIAQAHGTRSDHAAVATVQDYVAVTNVGSFGMCSSTSNPQVISATAAAQGTLTPMPCVPVITAPWSPGSRGVTLDHVKALSDDSTCSCSWAGTVSITDPGARPQES